MPVPAVQEGLHLGSVDINFKKSTNYSQGDESGISSGQLIEPHGHSPVLLQPPEEPFDLITVCIYPSMVLPRFFVGCFRGDHCNKTLLLTGLQSNICRIAFVHGDPCIGLGEFRFLDQRQPRFDVGDLAARNGEVHALVRTGTDHMDLTCRSALALPDPLVPLRFPGTCRRPMGLDTGAI